MLRNELLGTIYEYLQISLPGWPISISDADEHLVELRIGTAYWSLFEMDDTLTVHHPLGTVNYLYLSNPNCLETLVIQIKAELSRVLSSVS